MDGRNIARLVLAVIGMGGTVEAITIQRLSLPVDGTRKRRQTHYLTILNAKRLELDGGVKQLYAQGKESERTIVRLTLRAAHP